MTGIGASIPRHDGRVKVSGQAKYAGEEVPPGTLHAVLVPASIPAGRVSAVHTRAALRVPGVVRILVAADLPRLGKAPVPPLAQSFTPMQGDQIYYEGQPVAIVLAESLEAAEEAAPLVGVRYEPKPVVMPGAAQVVRPKGGKEGNGYAFAELDTAVGDFDTGWASAPAKVDQKYGGVSRHHNPMEPSATLAEWRGAELHVHDATQWTYGIRYGLAGLLGLKPEQIHVRCPYTGGAFGCKGYVWPHQILAPLAAKVMRRPVKLVLGRSGMYTGSGYQAGMEHRVRLAADAAGRLLAVFHETSSLSSMFDDYVEFGTAPTRAMYASPAIHTRTRIRHANVGTPTAMRAPHEGPGMFGLESAMDELAWELRKDPLELRLTNYAEKDPTDGRPFSSKQLRAAYVEGARRFRWAGRPVEPRKMMDGDLRIGWGMASCIMSTFRFAASARATMGSDGTVTLAAGCQELGTGAYTVLPQVAAEVLAIPAARIRLVLGDTSLPETGGTFGSSTTLSVGSAVKDAAERLRTRLETLAPGEQDWGAALRTRGLDAVSADGSWKPHGGAPFDATGGASGYSMHTFGAVFVEVSVDEALGLVRLRRAVGGYSAGRIVNPRTAKSQMIGGIIWGWGHAVLEQSVLDERYGAYLSKNLSGVMLPVNADIPAAIDVFFVDEHDPHASAIGAKGIGELGATGVAAAITNAVWHATGKRIRRVPIQIADIVS